MKRSQVNAYIREAIAFCRERQFFLPPFAFWTPEDWKNRGPEYDEIRQNELGWDLTDFGSGDFEKTGLLLFTIRNGNVQRQDCKKTYAEKMLIVRPGQVTPFHFHKSKMEDIINRGGAGELWVELYGSLDERTLDRSRPVPLAVDGRNYSLPPGTVIRLKAGESVTLFPGVFHQFYCPDAQLLLGEVSMVNDDHSDNFFLDPRPRFPSIEEDEPPLHLLVGDYR
jgi:D-lyxose ketol-isomerase